MTSGQPGRSFTEHLRSIPKADDDWVTELDAQVVRRRAASRPRSFPELEEDHLEVSVVPLPGSDARQ